MEISPVKENDSYVVLGGQKARHMGMDESAEGFHILSNTLYKHKKLACIREYLCNAVDAHIEAGVTRPVKVSIDNNQLAITDYGKGIEDASMVIIYGTYFSSTKKKDDRQTGGFGLGSKAGFAYTDHFIVTSRHNGKATTYAVHVGNEDTDGVPAMRQMNVCPTTETGVTVSVPIASASDCVEFINLCRRLVFEGGMNVELNGELLPTFDMDQLVRNGFALLPNLRNLAGQNPYASSNLAILGNVAYPIDPLQEFETLTRQLNKYIVKGYKRFVFRLAPGSARPIPSREGLSYNRQTIETLKKAMEDALAKIKTQEPIALKSMLEARFNAIEPTRMTLEAFFDEAFFENIHLTLKPGLDMDLRPLFDPAEIAMNFEAYKFAQGQTSHRVVHGFLKRRVANARKALRRIFKGRAAHEGIYNIGKEIRIERSNHMARCAIRAAVKTGLVDQLYRRYPGESESNGLFKCRYVVRGGRWGRRFPDAIIVCWNLAQARSIRQTGMVLVRSKLEDARVQEFVDRCKKMGFEVQQLPRPVPVVKTPRVKVEKSEKPVPPPPAWPRAKFNHCSTYRSNPAFLIDQQDVLTKPKAYICTGGGFEGSNLYSRCPDGYLNLDSYLDLISPDTVVTIGLKQTELAKKAGIPNLHDVVLDELEKRLNAKPRDSDEELYALATGFATSSSFYMSDDTCLQKFFKRGRRWALLAMDKPYKPDAEKDKGYALWMLARVMMGQKSFKREFVPTHTENIYWDEHSQRGGRLQRLEKELMAKIKKPLIFDAKVTDFKSQLGLLNIEKVFRMPEEELVALLGWIQKRQRQKQKGSEA